MTKSLPFIFNEADKKGLYYNWATSVGNKYTCISYSAGTTYATQKINGDPKLTPPEILIFLNNQFNDKKKEIPEYKLTLPVQGIRSSLLIDDVDDPYVLLGTFFYPTSELPDQSVQLIKWDFINNKIIILKEYTNFGNSIRKILRYKKDKIDLIYFSFQDDTQNGVIKPSFINSIWTAFITKEYKVSESIHTTNLLNQSKNIRGAVWDFSIDEENMYISIPQISPDKTKLSGFSTKGRVYYQKMYYLYPTDINISEKEVLSLIGNELYPNGFGINSLSTFQIQPLKDEIYIYSLSDFVYQLFSLQNFNQEKILLLLAEFDFNIFKLLKYIVSNLDIEGTRVFKINKSDLFQSSIAPIYTLVGEPPLNTINLSITNDGYNNFLNVYTWASCADLHENISYYGTLDIRSSIYNLLTEAFKNNTIIYNYLINLDEKGKILITEILLNKNFSLPIDYKNKELYFDVFNIKKNENNYEINKITSNGFISSNPLLPDEGVRNINVIKNKNGNFLLVGSTCYQEDNVSKNYIIKID